MPRSISLLLSKTGGPPHHGSVGYVNDAIGPLLERQGWDVRSFQPPQRGRNEEAMLPFGLAAALAREHGAGIADVALYDATGATVRTLDRQWARKQVVLYHGLAYGTGAWMTNPGIDLHCANSPYLARVLRSLFAFPDWRNRRCLNPAAIDRIVDVSLPVPCVDSPDGSPGLSHGSDIPPVLQRQFGGDLILAHAVQHDKQDWIATLSIMFWLNELAKTHRTPRVKLLVSEFSLGPEQRNAFDSMLAGSGSRCDDLFIPVPHLDQRALFRAMRACRFGLAYNTFPEPFGFYVLESVHNGTPVYTNGAGNNRFLLPPGHGIVVQETAEMAGTFENPPAPAAYRSVAERIHADLARPDALREDCHRGAALIDRTWSLAAFGRSLADALDLLDRPAPAVPLFDEMEIALSPLVRSFDPVSGRILDDYASGQLDPDAVGLVGRLLGRRCADLDGAEMARIEETHGLFRRGILTLLPKAEKDSRA